MVVYDPTCVRCEGSGTYPVIIDPESNEEQVLTKDCDCGLVIGRHWFDGEGRCVYCEVAKHNATKHDCTFKVAS